MDDLDLYKLTDGEKEESRKRYKDFPLKATFIIDSGGGRYLLGNLKNPVQKRKYQVESHLKRLALYFHGIWMPPMQAGLRIPGGLNHKYQTYSPCDYQGIQTRETIHVLIILKFFLNWRDPNCRRKTRLPKGWERSYWVGLWGWTKQYHKQISRKGIRKGTSQEMKSFLFFQMLILDSIPLYLRRKSKPVLTRSLKPTKGIIQKVRVKESRMNMGIILSHSGQRYVSSPEDETDWIWEGVLPSGGLSLVVAKPKVGKTTFSSTWRLLSLEEISFSARRPNRQRDLSRIGRKEGRASTESLQNGSCWRTSFLSFRPAPMEAMREVEPLIRETGTRFW